MSRRIAHTAGSISAKAVQSSPQPGSIDKYYAELMGHGDASKYLGPAEGQPPKEYGDSDEKDGIATPSYQSWLRAGSTPPSKQISEDWERLHASGGPPIYCLHIITAKGRQVQTDNEEQPKPLQNRSRALLTPPRSSSGEEWQNLAEHQRPRTYSMPKRGRGDHDTDKEPPEKQSRVSAEPFQPNIWRNLGVRPNNRQKYNTDETPPQKLLPAKAVPFQHTTWKGLGARDSNRAKHKTDQKPPQKRSPATAWSRQPNVILEMLGVRHSGRRESSHVQQHFDLSGFGKLLPANGPRYEPHDPSGSGRKRNTEVIFIDDDDDVLPKCNVEKPIPSSHRQAAVSLRNRGIKGTLHFDVDSSKATNRAEDSIFPAKLFRALDNAYHETVAESESAPGSAQKMVYTIVQDSGRELSSKVLGTTPSLEKANEYASTRSRGSGFQTMPKYRRPIEWREASIKTAAFLPVSQHADPSRT